MKLLILVAVTVALLAGCTTQAPTDPAPTTPPDVPTAPAAFSVVNDASGCFEAVMVVLVDLAEAQASLPQNWTAADAQSLLAEPVPTGKGAVWLNGYSCSEGAIAQGAELHGAEIGIVVAPPAFDAPHNGTAADLHIYQFAQVSPIQAVQDMYTSVGVPVLPGHVESLTTPVPLAMEGRLLVGNESATHYMFNYGVIEDAPMTTTASFWNDAEGGILSTHFSLDEVPVMRGAVYSCTLTGLAADLVGGAACEPGQAVALVVPEQAWVSTVSWSPGLVAVKA